MGEGSPLPWHTQVSVCTHNTLEQPHPRACLAELGINIAAPRGYIFTVRLEKWRAAGQKGVHLQWELWWDGHGEVVPEGCWVASSCCVYFQGELSLHSAPDCPSSLRRAEYPQTPSQEGSASPQTRLCKHRGMRKPWHPCLLALPGHGSHHPPG